MKKRTRNWILAVTVIAVTAGAFTWRQQVRTRGELGRRVLYYQDSMHPWIKSEQPGKCTICAMDLTPIYEGEEATAAEDLVVLSSNSVTVLNVQTVEVLRQPLRRTLRAAGTLEADNTRKTIVGAPAPGRIDDVAVESAGVDVDRGQVLATFYSPDLSFQTRRYIFRDRITSREDMTANENLLGSSRHAPRLPESTSSHPVPVSQQADPFYNDLLSPRSGTVVERNVYDGQYVAEGDQLFVIVDFSTLWFRFDVYEQQLSWLAPGQEVEVIVPAVPGRVFKAVISIIEPSFLDATRTAKVRADVENPLVGVGDQAHRLLRLGMYAEARVRALLPDRLVAPRSAILFPGGQAYAYVERSHGAYEMCPVELGRQGDAHWEILSGLAEGDRVVTSGNVLIDAQAQFSQGSQPGMASTASPETELGPPPEPLSPEQLDAIKDFLTVANAISVALAADDLDTLREDTQRLPQVVPALTAALQTRPDWDELMRRVQSHSRWATITSFETARKAFLPFSTDVVEVVERLRADEESLESLKVFFCPMAPKPGLWFQSEGPLRNPYYGAKMLTCGEEVKPKPRIRRTVAKAPPAHAMPAASPPISEGIAHHDHAAAGPTISTMAMPGPKENAHPASTAPRILEAETGLTESQYKTLEVFTSAAASKPPPTVLTPPKQTSHVPEPRKPNPASVRLAVAKAPAEPAADTDPAHVRGIAHYDQAAAAMRLRFAGGATNDAEEVAPAENPPIENAPPVRERPSRSERGLAAYDGAVEALGTRFDGLVAAPKVESASVISDSELKAMQALLDIAGGISEGLARDDLQQFNQQTARLTALLRVLEHECPAPHRWSEPVQRLAVLEPWPRAGNLIEARRHFLQFSTNVVGLARDLRKEDPSAFARLRIYQCPMAPPPGTWVQTNTPLRNPFYGSQMLDCGTEITEPTAAGTEERTIHEPANPPAQL